MTRPFWRAALWLGFLAPFFFVTYLGSLEIVSWREYVPVLKFDWERHIPFLAWTVVPYWSIDLLYGLSLFLCLTRFELDRLGLRLLSAQVIAVTIFLIAPLKLVSTIPAETGIFTFFFDALEGVVGKPFNLAPSLHIALLVILWVHYARYLPKRWHIPMHFWASLIGASVLTANQHHFFDLPTGAALGFFCLWLWPEAGRWPLAGAQWTQDPKRWRLAAIYGAGSALCVGLAVAFSGWFLWLLWPALSLLMVAAAYAVVGAALFQKATDGRLSLAVQWLLAPYLAGARLNTRMWSLPSAMQVAPKLRLGSVRDAAETETVVDLTAELNAPRSKRWGAHPMLDLAAPSPEVLAEAARSVEDAVRRGDDVLVGCALGLSRSAAVAATWLVAFGGSPTIDAAIDHLRKGRPRIILHDAHRAAIEGAVVLLTRDSGQAGLIQ